MKWMDTLNAVRNHRYSREQAKAENGWRRLRTCYRVPEDVVESIMADIEKRNAILEELKSYTVATIADRHGLHRRTVAKVLARFK